MEIPYIVNARKDTGLFNSKIAIWLFLASEVMLFGGFFSAYIFLRLGADYPWPERTLPILPGLINTFILIASSVTVVFAWASLKMRQWRKFQVYMGITVACAAIFMVLKGVEYNVKLNHQAVRLADYSVVEGHLSYEKEDGDYVRDHNGKKIEENMIRVKAESVVFSTSRFYSPWVEEMISEAKLHDAKLTLADDIVAVVDEGKAPQVVAKKGTELSVDLLNDLKKVYVNARTHNAKKRTKALRAEWKAAKAANPGMQGWELATDVNIDMEALKPMLLSDVSTATFNLSKPTTLLFNPRDIKEAEGKSRLRDDTVVVGELLGSPMVFHNVDAIDFQHLVMKAEAKGIAPEVAIENSWLMQNRPEVREAWEWHRKDVEKWRKVLAERGGHDDEGSPKLEPTHKELYRIGWKKFAEMGQENHDIEVSGIASVKEEFLGPNYKIRGTKTFPEMSIPREQVKFAAKFSPAWNTYYAIYFTITGLHGLHVIGGAFVLAYYLFFGRKMFLENPEWLCNRVEVGGLFWHFVDLVWIFAFPILYLM